MDDSKNIIRDELSPRPVKVLVFLSMYKIAANGGKTCPTYAEISAFMGWSGFFGVSYVLDSLQSMGYITRTKRKARSIKLTDKAIKAENKILAYYRDCQFRGMY